jgi:hypothetical protein
LGDYIGDLRKLIGTTPIIMCGANVILLNEKDEILLHHRVEFISKYDHLKVQEII